MMNFQKQLSKIINPNMNDVGLQLSPIQVNEDYCKEWNEGMSDFVMLTINGELISNNLYRIGGFGGDIKQDYFMLLKYVESLYEMDFLKGCYPNKKEKELKLHRKHLKGHWCIIDKKGIEKKVFDAFKTPSIIANSCIYSLENNYYNIETGEFYCESYKYKSSSEFLFLENAYDSDKTKRGVMKINKKDGSWELFK